MGDVTVWNLTWGSGYINLAYVKMHVTYTKKKKKEKRKKEGMKKGKEEGKK